MMDRRRLARMDAAAMSPHRDLEDARGGRERGPGTRLLELPRRCKGEGGRSTRPGTSAARPEATPGATSTARHPASTNANAPSRNAASLHLDSRMNPASSQIKSGSANEVLAMAPCRAAPARASAGAGLTVADPASRRAGHDHQQQQRLARHAVRGSHNAAGNPRARATGSRRERRDGQAIAERAQASRCARPHPR